MNQDKPTGVPEDVNERAFNMLNIEAHNQFINSGRMGATPFGLDGIPYARRQAIVKLMVQFMQSELTAKEEEIAKLKEEVERGGWISVEDRLPEKNGYYTTWCKDPYEHGLIHYNKETGWQNSFYNERVTHWKLLIPPPPKSK